ncbi:hypothetical protein [Larkinella rosea]|uniref:DUF975 family protein n=1 Tax=Larkinella rosea TaxID=2025312 RepID=A0A3P1BE70_9BACT|nr:hypothetical protein [Larkinella rosea]RRA99132.1 hypothetical protein EHT25_29610 [Larkinella rosea]
MLIFSAFRLVLRSWRMVLWLYLVNAGLGLLVLLPAYSVIRSETGSSLEYLKLLNHFDYTVYTDFRHTSGPAIDSLLAVGRWLGGLYLIVSIFFSGGILLEVSPASQIRQPFRLSRFLSACVHFFGRFFRLFLYVLSILLVIAFFGIFVGALAGYSLSEVSNEESVIYFAVGCVLVFGFLGLLMLCAGDYAKVLLFRRDENRALPAFIQAVRFVFAHFRLTFGLYLLLLSMGAVGFTIYFLIESLIVTSGWLPIGLLFIFQQLLIFSRVFLRVWMLATAMAVFDRKTAQSTLFQPI